MSEIYGVNPNKLSPNEAGLEQTNPTPGVGSVDFTLGRKFILSELPNYARLPDGCGASLEIYSGDYGFPRLPKFASERVVNEILTRPIADPESIAERREILRTIIHSGKNEQMLNFTDKAYELCDGLFELFMRKPLQLPSLSHAPTYQLYDRYIKGDETIEVRVLMDDYDYEKEVLHKEGNNFLIDVMQSVETATETIRTGIESVNQLATTLSSTGHTELIATADNLKQIAEGMHEVFFEATADELQNDLSEEESGSTHSLNPYDEPTDSDSGATEPRQGFTMDSLPGYGTDNTRYYYEEEHGGPNFGWAANLRERLEDIESILKIAKRIETQGWKEVTFNEDQPEGYRQAWNLSRPKEGQVLNDSVRDLPLTVLSAANGSGKTFHMESDLYLRVIAQSTGYAPVEEGNLHIYDSFAFLGRVSSSNEGVNRGAFISEMKRWDSADSRLGSKPCMYIDEGASTTSPEEQSNFLLGIASHILSRGGRIMLATHNEMTADAAESIDEAAVYHFASVVDTKKGELIFSHELAEGRDDSKFIALARARHFPEHLLGIMEQYINGSFEMPSSEPERTLPKIESYTENERASLKLQAGGIGYMFPVNADNPLFVLLSEDREIYSSCFDNNIDTLLFHSSPLAPQEILERQKTLKALLEGEQYSILEEQARTLMTADELAEFVALQTPFGLNRALNPLFDAGEVTFDYTDKNTTQIEPEKALAYLFLNKNLLGDDFPWQEHLEGLQDWTLRHEALHAEALELKDMQIAEDERQQQVIKHIVTLRKTQEGVPAADEEEFRELNALASERRDRLITIRESIYDIEIETAKRLMSIDTAFERGEISTFGFGNLGGSENAHLLDKLALPTREVGVKRPEEPDFDKQASILDINRRIRPASYLAYAILQIPLNDQRVENLQSSASSLNTVHVHQSVHHIVELYKQKRSKLEQVYQKSSVNNETSHSSIHRETGRFSSALSPLTRQPSTIQTQWRALIQQGRQGKDSELNRELSMLQSLAKLAGEIKERGYTPVYFNQTGDIEFKGVQTMAANSGADQPNDFQMNTKDETTKILTGQHGSGKTYYQKSTIQAIIMAQTLGYAPASYAKMPILDRVVYVDRVAQTPNSELSAGMQEIEYWKEVLRALDTPGLVLTAVDEAGSSTSPKYQAAFNAAIAHTLANQGHLLMMATHNHEAAGSLTAHKSVQGYHFNTKQVTEDRSHTGKARSHKLRKGVEPSRAIEAAKEALLSSDLLASIYAHAKRMSG